jgi:hypothetical protein
MIRSSAAVVDRWMCCRGAVMRRAAGGGRAAPRRGALGLCANKMDARHSAACAVKPALRVSPPAVLRARAPC